MSWRAGPLGMSPTEQPAAAPIGVHASVSRMHVRTSTENCSHGRPRGWEAACDGRAVQSSAARWQRRWTPSAYRSYHPHTARMRLRCSPISTQDTPESSSGIRPSRSAQDARTSGHRCCDPDPANRSTRELATRRARRARQSTNLVPCAYDRPTCCPMPHQVLCAGGRQPRTDLSRAEARGQGGKEVVAEPG